MAKLKGPLFSLGASQQLGKALVFFPWKGLNVVREYVVPSNPRTSGQTTQRAYVTAAVAAIHTAQGRATDALAAADVIAYAAWASVVKAATTWFNQAVKNWLDIKVAAKVPCIYSGFNMNDPSANNIQMSLSLNEETPATMTAGKFYFGTSKTALVNSQAATGFLGSAVQVWGVDLSAFLTAGIKYYVQFRPDSGDGCEGANSGIYNFIAT